MVMQISFAFHDSEQWNVPVHNSAQYVYSSSVDRLNELHIDSSIDWSVDLSICSVL